MMTNNEELKELYSKLDLSELIGMERSAPSYYRDPMIDRLVEVVLLLGAEVWSSRSRQKIIEQLLAENGQITPKDIEKFVPSSAFSKQEEVERKQLIRRLYKSLYGNDFVEEGGNFFDWLMQ